MKYFLPALAFLSSCSAAQAVTKRFAVGDCVIKKEEAQLETPYQLSLQRIHQVGPFHYLTWLMHSIEPQARPQQVPAVYLDRYYIQTECPE